MYKEKNELYSKKISAGKRTYFIDIKETKERKIYLTITETRIKDTDSFERHRVMIFEEDFESIFSELNNALYFVKEKTEAGKKYDLKFIK